MSHTKHSINTIFFVQSEITGECGMGNVTANKNLSTKTNPDITQLTELADNDMLTVILNAF